MYNIPCASLVEYSKEYYIVNLHQLATLWNKEETKMSDYTKVSSEVTNESSSVDSLNTNSCSRNTINETVNSIKCQESSSGFSTPPTSCADTCDSGFTEFFSNKAGTSNTTTSSSSSSGEGRKTTSDSPSIKTTNDHDNYSSSDSDSDSKWKSEEVTQAIDDDTSDSDSSSDFRSDENVENRISYRWIEWCHRQLIAGVNPRTILRKIFRNSEFPVPPGISDRELWGRIASFVTQPPARTRLKDINSIDHVIGLLTTCKNIIVLTGAGVSVSCGIPDFRSKSGIYQRLRSEIPEISDPHEIFDIRFFRKDPRPFFKFAKELFPGSFTPSLCHRFIRLLEKKDKLLRNYSQNIDTLERQAGIERVVECHGSFATASCTKCNHTVSANEIREDVLAQKIPMCGICNPVSDSSNSSGDNQPKIISYSSSMTDGYTDLYELGILKPDIVFFGESLPEVFHPAINADRQKCDLLLVVGSSLKVRPVSLIPEFLRADVPQILINRERIGNYVFDIEILGDADIVVNQLCHMLADDWTEICEQPQLILSSTLTFDPDKNETVNSNLVERTTDLGKLTQLTVSSKSPTNQQSTQNTDDSKLSSIESTNEELNDNVTSACSDLSVDALATESTDETAACSIKQPTNSCSGDEGKHDVVDVPITIPVTDKVFVFSIHNVPNDCYYLLRPNKYVFPGSTHTWHGSGKPNEDFEKEEEEEEDYIEINDEDDEDDDEDDDENVDDFIGDDDKCETEDGESSSNQCNSPSPIDSSDNDDVTSNVQNSIEQQGDDNLIKIRKRTTDADVEDNDKIVSQAKQYKMDDEEVQSAKFV